MLLVFFYIFKRLTTESRAVEPFHMVTHIKDNQNLFFFTEDNKKSNLGSLGLAQTILLLKDLGVLLKVLLDHLREAKGK